MKMHKKSAFEIENLSGLTDYTVKLPTAKNTFLIKKQLIGFLEILKYLGIQKIINPINYFLFKRPLAIDSLI